MGNGEKSLEQYRTVSLENLAEKIKAGGKVVTEEPIIIEKTVVLGNDKEIDLHTLDKLREWKIGRLSTREEDGKIYASHKTRTPGRKAHEAIFINFGSFVERNAEEIGGFVKKREISGEIIYDALDGLVTGLYDWCSGESQLKRILWKYLEADPLKNPSIKESVERTLVTCKLLDNFDYHRDKAEIVRSDRDSILMATILQDIALLAYRGVVNMSDIRMLGKTKENEEIRKNLKDIIGKMTKEEEHPKKGEEMFKAIFGKRYTIAKVGIRMHEGMPKDEWEKNKYLSNQFPALGNEFYTFTREKGWPKDVSPEGVFKIQANSTPGSLEKLSEMVSSYHKMLRINERGGRLKAYLEFVKSIGVALEGETSGQQFVYLNKNVGNIKLSKVEKNFLKNYIGHGLQEIHDEFTFFLTNGNNHGNGSNG